MLFDDGIDLRPQRIIEPPVSDCGNFHVAHIPSGVSRTGLPREDENNTAGTRVAWLPVRTAIASNKISQISP